MRHLLWKEWREQRWRLGFSCLLLLAFALVGLRARAAADELTLAVVCFGAVLLLPLQAAAGLVPADRADGSLATLLALPVRPATVWAAKTLAGAGLCLVPLAVTAAASAAYAGGRELSAAGVLGLFARAAAAALSLFAWMFAVTARSPTEARAGLLSLGVLVGWMLTLLRWSNDGPMPPGRLLLTAVSPFTFMAGFYPNSPVQAATAAVAQAGVAAALWLAAYAGFARPAEGKS